MRYLWGGLEIAVIGGCLLTAPTAFTAQGSFLGRVNNSIRRRCGGSSKNSDRGEREGRRNLIQSGIC